MKPTFKQLVTDAVNKFRDYRAVNGDSPQLQAAFVEAFVKEAMVYYSEEEVSQWLRSVGLGPQKVNFRDKSLYADAPDSMKPEILPDGSKVVRGVKFGPGPVAKNRGTKVLDVAGIEPLGTAVDKAS